MSFLTEITQALSHREPNTFLSTARRITTTKGPRLPFIPALDVGVVLFFWYTMDANVLAFVFDVDFCSFSPPFGCFSCAEQSSQVHDKDEGMRRNEETQASYLRFSNVHIFVL